jgi:hypothetical protein
VNFYQTKKEKLMRKAFIIACIMLFVSALGFAQTPSVAPLPSEALAAILGQTDSGDCAAAQPEVVLAAKRPSGQYKALCFAIAFCASGSVSCYGYNSTTSCSAWDRNCSIAERGHVTCDGVTTYCPTVCSPCELCAARGDCISCCRCDGGTIFQCRQECIEKEPIPKVP